MTRCASIHAMYSYLMPSSGRHSERLPAVASSLGLLHWYQSKIEKQTCIALKTPFASPAHVSNGSQVPTITTSNNWDPQAM